MKYAAMPCAPTKYRSSAARLLIAAIVVIGAARCQTAARADSPRTFQRKLLAASGVSDDQLDQYVEKLDCLAGSFRVTAPDAGTVGSQARAIHAFLHERVLRGSYRPSASNIGVALDGGPFNCAVASALFLTLAAECGLEAQLMSVRGHVWCRAYEAGQRFDVETTCKRWFEIFDRYAGVATVDVSPAMAEHRSRATRGRGLSERQILAIFHYNRGVTMLREQEFEAAVLANRRALSLDPDCRPARENLAAAEQAVQEASELATRSLR